MRIRTGGRDRHGHLGSALIGIALSRSRICFACQLSYQVKEPVGLADEQPVGREGFYSRHRTACLYRGRPNDRNFREIPAEERAWLGHDQIGLEVLPTKGRCIEVWKHETAIGQGSHRRLNPVASFVVPGLEVGGLGRADAQQDSQDLWMGYPLRQGRVEAAAALLDKAEMECRRVGDGLDVVRRSEVGIGPGYCRKLPGEQGWDCLREHERWVKIRVIGAAAIPRPPTGVDFEPHEIGEPFFCFVGAGRLTAFQSAKVIKVNWLCALRKQIGIEEGGVAELILGIVVDILRHVSIEDVQRRGVGHASARRQAWEFAILSPSEFGVLQPEIAFDKFDRGQ